MCPRLPAVCIRPRTFILLHLRCGTDDHPRFFAPQHSNNTAVETAFNESLNNDGALDAYAESIVWRLRGVHAMVRYVKPSESLLCC
jgi:hypothetical protein